MYHAIEEGAPFYVDEDDYVAKFDPAKRLMQKKVVKLESPSPSRASSSCCPASPVAIRACKRPRRAAVASVRSYAVPDSDDDVVMHNDEECKAAVKETNLQIWIRHLGDLLKAEHKKVNIHSLQLDASLSIFFSSVTTRNGTNSR